MHDDLNTRLGGTTDIAARAAHDGRDPKQGERRRPGLRDMGLILALAAPALALLGWIFHGLAQNGRLG